MTLKSSLFFLLGFFSILELFKYKFAGINVYPMDLFFVLSMLILIIELFNVKCCAIKFRNKTSKNIFLLLMFSFFLNINSIIPIIDGASSEYIRRTIVFSIKSVVLLVFFIVLSAQNYSTQLDFAKQFLKGIVAATFFHAVYSWVFFYDWYLGSGLLHIQLMESLGITAESVGHTLINYIIRPIVRASGLHWDPAYFGLWGAALIGFAFSYKNRRLLMLTTFIVLIPWFFTFSRTAYVALILASITFFIYFIKLVSLKKFVFSVLLLSFSFSVITITLVNKSESSDVNVSYIIESRTNTKSQGNQRHLFYPLYALEAVSVDPIHFLFGYGNRNSGRSFLYSGVDLPGWDVKTKPPFDIETDWFKILAAQGFIGFILYNILFIYTTFCNGRFYLIYRNPYYLYMFWLLIMLYFCGFFYVYIDSKWCWLLLMSSYLLINSERECIEDG
ncbi:O-antigen ligase family protein [Vibrio fluvialis]|nr:O-antigen ligase family protein [Vibrio fluvialis]